MSSGGSTRQTVRPDFLIIGAPKCGTTWLNRRLTLHPGIFMPDDEVHFFSRYFDRGWSWYSDHFQGAQAGDRIGENSNSYLTDEIALSRIVSDLPDARFICLLRNPVDRAYSSYGMQVDRGRANADIARYLDPDRSPRPHILTNGLYADLLERWFDAVGRDRIFVGLFDDVRSDPAGLYRDVLKFLDVDPTFAPDNLLDRENARKASGVSGRMKRMLWWMRPYLDQGPLRSVRDGPVGRAILRGLSKPKRYPEMTPDIRKGLVSYYSKDMTRLETMLGRSLTAWREG
jgi:hypothetical protein